MSNKVRITILMLLLYDCSPLRMPYDDEPTWMDIIDSYQDYKPEYMNIDEVTNKDTAIICFFHGCYNDLYDKEYYLEEYILSGEYQRVASYIYILEMLAMGKDTLLLKTKLHEFYQNEPDNALPSYLLAYNYKLKSDNANYLKYLIEGNSKQKLDRYSNYIRQLLFNDRYAKTNDEIISYLISYEYYLGEIFVIIGLASPPFTEHNKNKTVSKFPAEEIANMAMKLERNDESIYNRQAAIKLQKRTLGFENNSELLSELDEKLSYNEYLFSCTQGNGKSDFLNYLKNRHQLGEYKALIIESKKRSCNNS